MEGEVIAEGVPQGEERSGVFDPRLVVVAHLTEEPVGFSQEVMKRWSGPQGYQLLTRDCVTFVEEVIRSLG